MLALLLATAAHAAPLDELAWLAGTWRGEQDGAVYEETWHPPLGGVMLGTFRLVARGEVVFYELMTLGNDRMSIKHFSPDLVGWEPRTGAMRFRVVEADATHGIFVRGGRPERLVYTRDGDALAVRVEVPGSVDTFRFARVTAEPPTTTTAPATAPSAPTPPATPPPLASPASPP